MGGRKDIEIKRVEKIDDLFRIAEIQQIVWSGDSLVVTSPHLVKVHVELGALMLGAYSRDGKIIGFAYSFPGSRRGERMHWSHMLGVIPDFRGIGLGKELKWRQRDEVLKENMALCCWTFDPLQAVNARLNIVSLGATACEYLVDAYSSRDGYLDGGLPTDRFVARWKLNSQRAIDSRAGKPLRIQLLPETIPLAYVVEDSSEGCLPSKPNLKLEDEFIGLQIPADINAIRTNSLQIANVWRLTTRETLTNYFKMGYSLVDCLTPKESETPHFLYILQRQ